MKNLLKNEEAVQKLQLPDEALRLGAASIVMWLTEGNVLAALQLARSMCSDDDIRQVKEARTQNKSE